MKNAQINRLATIKVAQALGSLCDEVIFVGGAMVILYIDDPAAEEVRSYLIACAQQILSDSRVMSGIPGHLAYDNPDEQLASITHTLNQLAHGLA